MPKCRQRVVIPEGETIFDPEQSPFSIDWVQVSLDRNNWSSSAKISLSIHVSFDNITWKEVGSCTSVGGNKKGPTSQRINFSETLPLGTLVKVIVKSSEPLDTRVLIKWQ